MEISSQSDDRMNPTNIHPSSIKWISQKCWHNQICCINSPNPCSLKWLLLASKVRGVRGRLYGMMQFLSKPFSALQLPHQLQPVVGGLSFSFQIVEQLLAMGMVIRWGWLLQWQWQYVTMIIKGKICSGCDFQWWGTWSWWYVIHFNQ